MAMAARRERGLLDPDAPEGESLFDHTIWAFASDGDLEEGVSGEASSLAGTQQLGNLVLVYDDNKISIEDDTNIAFTEDVAKRYEAYGWHVQRVDDGEDLAAVDAAFAAAKAETSRPSFIQLRTIIALAGAQQAEHRRRARLGAGRRRGQGHQADPRLRPGADLRGRPRGHRARPQGRRPRPEARTPPGRSGSTPGRRATPRAPRCWSG